MVKTELFECESITAKVLAGLIQECIVTEIYLLELQL